MLRAMALANALALLPGGNDVRAGGRVEVLLLDAAGFDSSAAEGAVRFLLEEAGIRQVRCRDSGRSSRARLCGPRAEADKAMDPSLWSDVTKDPYLSCARA